MGSRPALIAFSNREAMAARLADVIEAALARAIAARGSAVIAVSGGSTPAGLYEALSRRKIDWERVSAVLVDERWVPPGAEGSNESFVRAALRRNEAAALNLVGLWSDAPSPEEGLAAAAARLSKIGDTIDVAVLGMGNDGHTASWFPNAKGLAQALSDNGERLAAVTARPNAITGDFLERMTLTLGAVKSSQLVFLLMTGVEKRATFERSLEDGPVEEMPVRAILDARADLWAVWAP